MCKVFFFFMTVFFLYSTFPGDNGWDGHEDMLADVEARWMAVHQGNLGPVPVATIQQKVLPLPRIMIPQAYLDRLVGLEMLWRGQGACVEGFESHILKLHKASSCWAHEVILDFEGLIPHKETKSRFCSMLTNRSRI